MLQGVHFDFNTAQKSKMYADVLCFIFRLFIFILCKCHEDRNVYVFFFFPTGSEGKLQRFTISVNIGAFSGRGESNWMCNQLMCHVKSWVGIFLEGLWTFTAGKLGESNKADYSWKSGNKGKDAGEWIKVGGLVWPQVKFPFYLPCMSHSLPPLFLCAGGSLSLEHSRCCCQNLPKWSGKSMAFGVRKIWVLNCASLFSYTTLDKFSGALNLSSSPAKQG